MTLAGSLLGLGRMGAGGVCGVGEGSSWFAQEIFLMKKKPTQRKHICLRTQIKAKSVQTHLQFWNFRLIGLDSKL